MSLLNLAQVPNYQGSIVKAIFQSDLTWLCIAVAMLCLFIIIVSMRVLWRSRKKQSLSQLPTDTNAVATMEFTLVLPVLLFMILLLTQTMLMMGGNLMVHYAAFAATRSAITYIPQNTTDPGPWPVAGQGEPANIITPNSQSLKHNAIFDAAWQALLPVAGRDTSGSTSSGQIVSGFENYFSSMGATAPNWVDQLLPGRINYAINNTLIQYLVPHVIDDQTVEFIELPDGIAHEFSPLDPVTIRVIHKFNMSMPWANRIFSDGTQSNGLYYRQIHAAFTLNLQGIRDELPPEPTLPRDP